MQHETQQQAPSALSFSHSSVVLMWKSTEMEGSRVTEDFLEALTERMGLHYCNEATGMAATLPSFTPSQPAPPPGIHSFLCNSLLSLLLLPLLCSLLSFPFYYPRNLQEVCTFVRVHEGGMFHMRSLRLMRHAGMCPATRPSYTA